MTGDSKDKIQYATAVLMLVSGVVLSFFSFFYYYISIDIEVFTLSYVLFIIIND